MAIVAAFAVAPFSRFLEGNRDQPVGVLDVVPYALAVLVVGLIVIAVARDRSRGERAAVVYATAVTALFAYRPLADAIAAATTVDAAVWLVVLAVGVVVAWVLSRHEAVRTFALVAGVLLALFPLAQFVIYRAGDDATSTGGEPVAAASERDAVRRPDVIFVIFDEYGSFEQIERVTGFRDPAAQERLRERGFELLPGRASYPETQQSVPSTLSMSYWDEDIAARANPTKIISGANPVVETFRQLGYRYVHSPPETNTALVPCGGDEDVCVDVIDQTARGPLKSLDDTDWAVLEMTPAGAPLRSWTENETVDTLNRPERLLDALDALGDDRPVFAYSHVMLPHGPLRVDAECNPVPSVPVAPLPERNQPPQRDRFLAQVQCADRMMVELADGLERRGRDAIVIFQGDHGTQMTLDFEKDDQTTWDADQIEERFSTLYALSLPEECKRAAPGDRFAVVNTFRVVFACLEDREPDLLPYRAFVSGDGGYHEVDAPRP